MTFTVDLEIGPKPIIREKVYEYLRNKILIGELESGDRLSEGKLAGAIGTSRTPVREALHKLEMESLIRARARSGYIVVGILRHEVEEICEIRVALETLAAKWASARITIAGMDHLHEIVTETRRKIEIQDTDAVVRLDTEFHDLICKASGSKRLVEISQGLRDQMLRFRIRALCFQKVALRSNEGHERIIKAIESKNPRRIEDSVQFHLRRTIKDVKKKVEGSVKNYP